MNLITKAEDRVQSGLCRQLFILGLLLVNLMACDSGQKPLPEKAVHIGFSMDSLVVERWTHDLAEFQSYAQAQGATGECEDWYFTKRAADQRYRIFDHQRCGCLGDRSQAILNP
jgi:hypothetical protein